MTGELEEAGDVESSSPGEYCSLSDRIVTPDSAMWLVVSSDDILDSSFQETRGAPLSRMAVWPDRWTSRCRLPSHQLASARARQLTKRWAN
jgi:hypothetical protein